MRSYGYSEIATPTFESLELFTKKSGQDITKQLYNFQDKGEREICLRPELTAPVMRFYFNELRSRPKHLKIFYYGNCFRYERPQDGRYREFFQFGVELVGGSTTLGNAELIDCASSCLCASGLNGFKIRVGHLGVLRNLLNVYGITEEQRKYIMPLIDKGEYVGLEDYLVEQGYSEDQVMKILNIVQYKVELQDFLDLPDAVKPLLKESEDSLAALEELFQIAKYMDDMGTTNISIDLGIARGLDYYIGMVFEADLDELGAEKQICGGGHYSLSEVFDSPDDVTATGFAIGFDRVMLGLQRQNYELEKPDLDVFIVPMGDETLKTCLGLIRELRDNGLRTDMDQGGRALGKNLKYAQARGSKFAVFIGSDELTKGTAQLKNLDTREQVELPIAEILGKIRQQL